MNESDSPQTVDSVTRLRQTRADMIGTDDEAHYFDCHEAEIAARIKEVKDSWTPEDETVRLVGNGGRVFWVLPEYCVQYVSGDPTSKSSRRQDNRTKIYRRLN